MVDYREKEHRKEAFIRWYTWSMKYGDCDPAVWMTNYLNKRFEHNSEQKFWLAWLYGNTYNLPTAWVLLNEFPDFELADQERIESWNSNNYKRLRYQTDTKWNKGHLPSMFKSYKEYIGNRDQQDFFLSMCQGAPEENFNIVWNSVKNSLYKFGRYSTWFYLQHLKSTCNLPIEASSMMLDDYDGSRSHRNGLLYALGLDDWIDKKLSTQGISFLEEECEMILKECKKREPSIDFDRFTLETCLCSFKKIFRERDGRYLGYYLDRQAEEIKKAESDGWYGIDWNVLWQARSETLDERLNDKIGVKKERYPLFLSSGKISRLEFHYQDEKDENNFIDM